ncbi:hypothetical protein BS50DRAFT_588436 [Corynespora cassiicola Philippines]|uniref:Uncharacterized protein n=1 Tax=Corynespora cassiicola Philippines TaxID=1448308 RepID=A0A2T2NQW6_CORCC|nr:hypothetical protein BS50DRAFT_588436 [Corynespora cassiicola Philippines]
MSTCGRPVVKVTIWVSVRADVMNNVVVDGMSVDDSGTVGLAVLLGVEIVVVEDVDPGATVVEVDVDELRLETEEEVEVNDEDDEDKEVDVNDGTLELLVLEKMEEVVQMEVDEVKIVEVRVQ